MGPTADAQLAVLEALVAWASAERTAGLLTTAVGAAALLSALALWLGWARPWALGAAVPLGLFGLVDVAVGAHTWLSASRDLESFPAWVREAPHLVSDDVGPRLERRIETGDTLTGVLLLCAVAGVVVSTRAGRLRGVGVALVVVCSVDVALERSSVARARGALSLLGATPLSPGARSPE
ncbi:MAG: hypothetical protein MUC96_24740 [Myxococcaceae bacterium]|jgi:hypothetical protein|nr:hypothetical protein [Myxococcaceae bacterium]